MSVRKKGRRKISCNIKMKKQQKRIPQITHRLEQIEEVMDKLYEDNALGAIAPDRYEQLSQKYAEEYYPLKKELEEIRARLSDHENQSQRAKKFIRLVESYCDFEEVTPTAKRGFLITGNLFFVAKIERSDCMTKTTETPDAPRKPDGILTTQINNLVLVYKYGHKMLNAL